MDNSTFSSLIAFVIQHNELVKENLSKDTKLYKDLHLTGEDAAEFLESFAREFKVDVSRFQFDLYFAPEGLNMLYGNEGKKDLTLGQLEAAIEKGVLE